MVATVNPCGFALLPAYLGAFVGLDEHRDRPGRFGMVGRALAVSTVLTAGFVTVFGLIGLVFGEALAAVQERAPWFTIVLGLAVAALGLWLVTGHQLSLAIPKLQRGGADGTLASMYLFGVSYATASLGCAVGPFLGVTSGAQNSGSFVSRALTFVSYGVGMGLVIAVLTAAVAFAKQGLVARFRAMIPRVNLVAGALMMLTGTYVAYYGWYEIRVVQRNGDPSDPVIDRALSIQQWFEGRMPNTQNYGWYVVVSVAVLAAAVAWGRATTPAPPERPGGNRAADSDAVVTR
jgi:cytochrome c biogenesis protein CcdA